MQCIIFSSVIIYRFRYLRLLFFYGNDIFPIPLLSYVFPIKSHLVEKQILYISGVNRLSNTSNSGEFWFIFISWQLGINLSRNDAESVHGVQLPRHQSEKLISVIPRLFPLPGNIQHSLFLYHCTPCPLVYFLFSSWFFPSNGIGYFPSALRAVCRLAPPVFQPTFLYHPLGHCLLLLDERTLSFSTLNRSTDKNRCLKEKEYRVLFIGGWGGGSTEKPQFATVSFIDSILRI